MTKSDDRVLSYTYYVHNRRAEEEEEEEEKCQRADGRVGTCARYTLTTSYIEIGSCLTHLA